MVFIGSSTSMSTFKWCALIFAVSQGWWSYGQSDKLEILKLPKEKRIFAIEARIGYYWDLQSVPDSIVDPLSTFYKKLGRGPRADFSVLYNWKDILDIGFNYAYMATSASTERITISYITAAGLQRQLYGNLSGEIRQQYFALRVDPHFELKRSFAINPGVSSGFTTYYNTTRIDDLVQTISGRTMAFEIHLGVEYFLDQNFSLNLNGSYMLSFLHEPEITNTLEIIDSENLSAGLSKWYLGFGLRYTFTKKGSAVSKPNRDKGEETPKRKGRFN